MAAGLMLLSCVTASAAYHASFVVLEPYTNLRTDLRQTEAGTGHCQSMRGSPTHISITYRPATQQYVLEILSGASDTHINKK